MNIKKIIQEEINDFGWVDEINPTLFEYFENDILEVGDVVTVRGETLDSDGIPVLLDKGKYLITHLDEFGPGNSNMFIRSKVVFDNETQQKLDIYKETSLIEEDKGLEVLDHQRGGTMDMGDNVLREDDGDGLDWVREVEPKRIEPCVKRGKCKEYVITGLESLSSNKVLEVLSAVNDLGWYTRDFEDWWDYEDLCYFYLERRGNCNWDDCELGYHEEDGEYYNYEEITPQDILNVVPQEKGLWGRYIDKLNESDDLDWIRNTNPVAFDDFINKAFYFDPTAEEGDEDYAKLVDKLNDLGFSPVYGTTSFVGEGNYIAGLFSYLDFDRNPKYVFTHDDVDTRTWDGYEEHIKGYALGESEARDDLEVVDARAFVTQFT